MKVMRKQNWKKNKTISPLLDDDDDNGDVDDADKVTNVGEDKEEEEFPI